MCAETRGPRRNTPTQAREAGTAVHIPKAVWTTGSPFRLPKSQDWICTQTKCHFQVWPRVMEEISTGLQKSENKKNILGQTKILGSLKSITPRWEKAYEKEGNHNNQRKDIVGTEKLITSNFPLEKREGFCFHRAEWICSSSWEGGYYYLGLDSQDIVESFVNGILFVTFMVKRDTFPHSF